MNVAVETRGTNISLKAYKEHFTLYGDEMVEWGWLDGEPEDFYDRVDDYLRDVLPDEGHSDWTWKSSDLKKVCKEVYKNLKR
jgi:hypothetical protein